MITEPYGINGLVFWTERQLGIRRMLVKFYESELVRTLRKVNRGFSFIQVEAPILTPINRINTEYLVEDRVYIATSAGEVVNSGGSPDNFELHMRPETTMGSYAYATYLMEHQMEKLPMVVWQDGKSFRIEQDQVTKNVRLKEFNQLEFQILYSEGTKAAYADAVVPAVCKMIGSMIGAVDVQPSDRVPSYAEWTLDVIAIPSHLELCSISKRKDFEHGKCLEVAIGTDRCVYLFNGE